MWIVSDLFIHSVCVHCVGVDNEEKSPSLLANACKLSVILRVVRIFLRSCYAFNFKVIRLLVWAAIYWHIFARHLRVLYECDL
jgi:hypothetical protein